MKTCLWDKKMSFIERNVNAKLDLRFLPLDKPTLFFDICDFIRVYKEVWRDE